MAVGWLNLYMQRNGRYGGAAVSYTHINLCIVQGFNCILFQKFNRHHQIALQKFVTDCTLIIQECFLRIGKCLS